MERFRKTGLKLIPQRVAILEYLDGNEGRPSVETIYEAVKKQYPMMSLATVYNTMEALKAKGMIRELTIDPEKRRYDPDTKAHHHLICSGCRRIVDIYTDSPIGISDEKKASFEVTGNHIEFFGICPECRKKEED